MNVTLNPRVYKHGILNYAGAGINNNNNIIIVQGSGGGCCRVWGGGWVGKSIF